MNKTIVHIILVGWLITLSLIGFAQDKSSPLIDAGKQNLLDDNYEQAIINFGKHISIYGYSSDAYYWRSHALLALEKHDAAIKDLNYVLEKDATNYKAMDALGFAFNQKGQYLSAIKWFNKALEHDDNSAIIYNNRGMSYYYLGKYNTAFHDFNRAVIIDTTFAQAFNNRGSARYNHQDIKKASFDDLQRAEKDYSKAIELDPKLTSAYRNRGIVRFEMEDYKQSYLDFKKAIHLDPNDPLIHFHTANLMVAMEEYPTATNYFNESLKLAPLQIDVLYSRAENYLHQKQFDLARYDYEIISAEFPEEKGKCFYLVAQTYALENDSEHAYNYLNYARKEGYFKSGINKKKVLEADAFAPFWEQSNFARLKAKIKKS